MIRRGLVRILYGMNYWCSQDLTHMDVTSCDLSFEHATPFKRGWGWLGGALYLIRRSPRPPRRTQCPWWSPWNGCGCRTGLIILLYRNACRYSYIAIYGIRYGRCHKKRTEHRKKSVHACVERKNYMCGVPFYGLPQRPGGCYYILLLVWRFVFEFLLVSARVIQWKYYYSATNISSEVEIVSCFADVAKQARKGEEEMRGKNIFHFAGDSLYLFTCFIFDVAKRSQTFSYAERADCDFLMLFIQRSQAKSSVLNMTLWIVSNIGTRFRLKTRFFSVFIDFQLNKWAFKPDILK